MWRFLSSPVDRLPDLLGSFARVHRSDCVAATWARGARRREASLPHTPCSPCRPLASAPLILHALVAPGERQDGPPLRPRGPPRVPGRLARGPRPRRRAARP